jgi:hypothetical protein
LVGGRDGGVVHQLAHMQAQGSTQRNQQVQRGGQLHELDALDGGLLLVAFLLPQLAQALRERP